MGDDGHWKPPAFRFDAPVTPSTPPPDEDDEPRRRLAPDLTRAKAEAKRLARSAGTGIFGVACLVGAIAAGTSVYNGVKQDEARISPIDLAEAEDPDADREDHVQGDTTPIGDAAAVCPAAAEVATALGRPEAEVRYSQDDLTRVNGIPLWGVRCNYGPDVHVGAEPPTVQGRVVDWLKTSDGEHVVSEGPFGDGSVTLTRPDGAAPGSGIVRVVFTIGGRTFWVAADIELEDRVEHLARLVFDHNGGTIAPPTDPATEAEADPADQAEAPGP